MTGLAQDVRYACRQLIKSREFTATAVLTLAIGIGANTSIFSVVNGVLITPLPFPNANRIVSMFQDKPNFTKGSISYPNFLDLQRDSRAFESVAAYRWGDGNISGPGVPEEVKGQRISATFFPILGVTPILGRNFTADEDQRGASPTALISEGLWKRKFGSDPNIVGKRIIVAGAGRTIVGVIPASFQLRIQNFRTADIYEPIGEDTDPGFYRRDSFWGTDAIALLKPGVTLEQARQDMWRVNAALALAYPDINANIKATIISLKEEIVGEMRLVLLVLLGAVSFVLLIACVNVANLLLARSTARQREFSIRIALGAGQGRIIRQLIIESVALSMIGGAIGLILAKWGTSAAIAAVPSSVPRAEGIGLDLRVLLFTILVSIITGIAFGLVPALRMCRISIGKTLKDTARAISGHHSRAQAAFVVVEMAMALLLLAGAGLMLRSLVELWGVNPGFDPHQVLNFNVTPPPSLANQTPDAIRAALHQIEATIRSVPGVEYVSMNGGARPMENDDEISFWVEGTQPPGREADLPNSLEYIVGPQYLKTMRIPLVRGRFIGEADVERSEPIAVIDTSFAQKFFPGHDPVGKHIRVLEFDRDATERTWVPLVIVGVVRHVNQWGLADDSTRPLHAQLYRTFMQGSDVQIKDFAHGAGVFVRFQSSLNAEAFFETIRKKLLASNGEIIVSGNESEESVVSRSIANQCFSLMLLGIFAALAVLLAGLGVYGVLSYLVGHRTQEIGVRMALGAQPLDVLRMVVGDGARMTLVGAAIGVVFALGLTREMESLLFGVKPTDPITLAAVVLILFAIAMFACYLPARRAMRVDPVAALRYE